MVVSSLSQESDRAGALARLGVSYGLGQQLGTRQIFLFRENMLEL